MIAIATRRLCIVVITVVKITVPYISYIYIDIDVINMLSLATLLKQSRHLAKRTQPCSAAVVLADALSALHKGNAGLKRVVSNRSDCMGQFRIDWLDPVVGNVVGYRMGLFAYGSA